MYNTRPVIQELSTMGMSFHISSKSNYVTIFWDNYRGESKIPLFFEEENLTNIIATLRGVCEIENISLFREQLLNWKTITWLKDIYYDVSTCSSCHQPFDEMWPSEWEFICEYCLDR